MSTAYAVWTGLSIVGTVVADLPARPSALLPKAACILLILAGTTGLRMAGAEPGLSAGRTSPPREGPRTAGAVLPADR